MRIALFVETYLPYINGVVTHVKVLKEGLESLGHEVLVVTADPHARHHYISDHVLHCPAKSIKRLYGYGIAPPVSQRRLRYIKEFNPDIIHIHQEFGIGMFGIIAARTLKKPLVYTLHTMYDEYIYYVAPKRLVPSVKRVSHKYAKYIAKQASALTGPSPKVEKYFQEAGVYKKVNIVPNPVELDLFDPSKVSDEQKIKLREKYNIPEDSTIAIFVGRLGREKSVDVLLNYWAECIKPEDRLHLLVIGEGPCLDELKEQASLLGINNMVTFTGKVEHDKVAVYCSASDIYVTASLSDTNSISMLEGMATGLPVLQRFDQLNVGQVRDGVNGYNFHTAKEMFDIMKSIRDKSPEELLILKKSVIESVRSSGAENLANYLLTVYTEAYKNKQEADKK